MSNPGFDQIAFTSSEKLKVETVIHMLCFGRLSIPQSHLKRFMVGTVIVSILPRYTLDIILLYILALTILLEIILGL